MGFLLCLYGEYIDNATIIDVMEWMINTQLGRRNLPPAQRISVVDKFKKKIQEQAAMNKSDAIAESNKKRASNVLQMEKDETNKKERIHTDKELAKMAGVGTGTIARYNRVMNSDDETKQRKVAVEYVKLCGYKQGRPQKESNMDCLSLDEIASQLGTSKTNLKRAL